jgi:hypothetical protein
MAGRRPDPPDLEPAQLLRGFSHWFTRVTPSGLACRTRLVWQYRAVPTLSGLLAASRACPAQAAPTFTRTAATARRRRIHTSIRSCAPRGAPPGSCRPSPVSCARRPPHRWCPSRPLTVSHSAATRSGDNAASIAVWMSPIPVSTARHCASVNHRANPAAVVELNPTTGASTCRARSARRLHRIKKVSILHSTVGLFCLLAAKLERVRESEQHSASTPPKDSPTSALSMAYAAPWDDASPPS